MKLRITADDLGYTPAINQAIFDLHSRGRICAASLIVNMPFSQDAFDGLRSHPNLAAGVHLNLTKGRPVLPQEQIPTLVNPAGKFWNTKSFYMRAVTAQINHSQVEAELRAQIEQVLYFGIQPVHIDSHSHWHLLPNLRKIVIRLAEVFQIPGIRQSAIRRTLLPSPLWLAAAAHNKRPPSEFNIPDYLLSLHHWIGRDGLPIDLFYSKNLRRLIAGAHITLELVTHPGILHDPYFPQDTLRAHQRQWEYDFLRSSRFDDWLEIMEAQIIPQD